MQRHAVAGALALLGALMPAASQAALESCSVSATSVAFGAYDPLNASPAISAGTVSVTCTVSLIALLWTVDIKLSAGGSGSFATRRMTSGASQLDYNLYLNSARTTIWGDGTGGSSYASPLTPLAVGTTTQNFPVYGRIPAGQDRSAGAYTDTIVVTIEY
jgi:spore coat protein U-like protein